MGPQMIKGRCSEGQRSCRLVVPAQVPEAGCDSTSLSQLLSLPPCTKNTHGLGIQVKRKQAKHACISLSKTKDKSSLDSNCIKKWEQNTVEMSQVRALKNPLLGSAQWDAVAASEFQVFSLWQGLIDRSRHQAGELRATSSGESLWAPSQWAEAAGFRPGPFWGQSPRFSIPKQRKNHSWFSGSTSRPKDWESGDLGLNLRIYIPAST